MDNELADIMAVPYEREGALLDEIRKGGVHDASTQKAVIAAVRLLKGIEENLTPEIVEKLGQAIYGPKNPKLNSGGVPGEGELVDSDGSDEDLEGSGSGAPKDGSGRDGELFSRNASAPKVAASHGEPDEDDMDKAEFSEGDRKSLAGRGQALPDGSYPIRNKSDLHNAIQAYGRAKDKGRAKAWIMRRASALGATGMLPDSWKVSKEELEELDEYLSDSEDVSAIDKQGDGTVEIPVPVRKEDGTWDFSGVPSESRPFYEEIILKAETAEKELKETREELAKSQDELRTRSMIEKAAAYSHVAPADDLAPILKSVDDETREKLEALLASAEERIAKGGLFQEMGARATDDGSTKSGAYETAVEKAKALVEKGESKSEDSAIAQIFEENPSLYSEYLVESGMGVS